MFLPELLVSKFHLLRVLQYFWLYWWCYMEYTSVRNSPTEFLYLPVKNNFHPQGTLKNPTVTCRQENNWIGSYFVDTIFLRLNWLVWLPTTCCWSNRSYCVNKTGIPRSMRPSVSYFHTKRDNLISNMGRNLLLNSINRGLENFIYRKKAVML